MVIAAATSPSPHQFVFSRHHRTLSAFPSSHLYLSSLETKGLRYAGAARASRGVRCAAVGTATVEYDAKSKKTGYELQTLTTWWLRHERDVAIDTELIILLSSISMTCKQIASLVQRAGIANLTGVQDVVNVHGEDQKKLDVVSNKVFSNFLKSSARTGIIASEEEDVPVAVEESYSGNYIVVFDPLNGSSNIDALVSAGSIFGINSVSVLLWNESAITLEKA